MREEKIPSAIDIAAGLWLLAAPFVLGYAHLTSARWTDLAVGAIVTAIAVSRFAGLAPSWLSWVGVAAGFWLLVAPYVLNYASYIVPLTNDLVLSMLIIGMGTWSALVLHRDRRRAGVSFASAEPSERESNRPRDPR